MPSKPVQIYGLVDPRTGKIRYVGATTKMLRRRIGWHIFQAVRNQGDLPVHHWIRELLAQGRKPEWVIFEVTDEEHLEERENHWIDSFDDLLNVSRGGRGFHGKHTDEARAKIGAASRGKPRSEEVKAKIRATKLAKRDEIAAKSREMWKRRKGQ